MSRYIIILLIAVVAGAVVAYADTAVKRCNEPSRLTFKDWRDWWQVTSKPVVSAAHNNNWVGIFVDKLAKDTYLNASAPYPVCAKIVKPIYNDAEGKSVRKLTIMVKMPPGYDPENGNWWYASYDKTGQQIFKHGKLNDCIQCHKQAVATDYLFSEEVLKSVHE